MSLSPDFVGSDKGLLSFKGRDQIIDSTSCWKTGKFLGEHVEWEILLCPPLENAICHE